MENPIDRKAGGIERWRGLCETIPADDDFPESRDITASLIDAARQTDHTILAV